MAYDLRDFIADLKKVGELVEVDREVDWNYEISAFEVMSGRVGVPAFLFNKIKGTPEGQARMLVGFFAGTFRREQTDDKRIKNTLNVRCIRQYSLYSIFLY